MDGRPSLGKATAFFQRMHFSDAGLHSPGLFFFLFYMAAYSLPRVMMLETRFSSVFQHPDHVRLMWKCKEKL